jgi:AsmA protein
MLRSMARRLPAIARTTGAVLLTLLIVFAAFRVTAPFLISSALVRSGIEDALSKWTGYRAEIEGTPTLDFWPTPRITLNQVTIRQPNAAGKVLGHVTVSRRIFRCSTRCAAKRISTSFISCVPCSICAGTRPG